MADSKTTPTPAVTEDSPLTPQEVKALLARVHKLEQDAEKRTIKTPADEPETEAAPEMPQIEVQQLDRETFEGVRRVGKRETPDLYKEMVELDAPTALHPDEALYAVRLKTQGKGYWPAYPRPRREVRLADPGCNRLIPKRNPNSRDVVPEEVMKNPQPNFIGRAFATPWFVPALGIEVFCDPRAAAHENTPQMDKISLWCPMWELSPDSTHAHEEHGAFCGVGEEADRIQSLKWEPNSEEDEGCCMGCKDAPDKRRLVRDTIERMRR